jgi:hypothetical protein
MNAIGEATRTGLKHLEANRDEARYTESAAVGIAPPPVVRGLGFWSGSACATMSFAFLAGTVVSLVALPANVWTGDAATLAATFTPWPMLLAVVPSVLIAPAFLGLIVAIYSHASAERKPLVLFALTLASVYAAIVVVNYFLQLTVVRLGLENGRTDGLALLVMDNPHGVFWPLEALGYGVQGIAAGIAATAFVGGGLARWVRTLFIVVGVGGVLSIAAGIRGVSFSDPIFILGGAAWGIAFPLGTALAAAYFRRLNR